MCLFWEQDNAGSSPAVPRREKQFKIVAALRKKGGGG